MPKKISAEHWLSAAKERVILDVRTPAEYEQGHLPGAQSLPLFSNEERAVVGTLYKQQGPQHAYLKGLEYAGLKMALYVKESMQLAPEGKVLVHCWRGGKRSESMAWLLEQAGMDVEILTGGYKAFRRWVLQIFEKEHYNIQIVGGSTGTGKTAILHALQAAGEQIIDLEALAHHKGSAFGALGEQPQPSVEHFENKLATMLQEIDPQRRLWLEDESRSIGRVYLPDGFWNQMKAAPLYRLNLSRELRVQRLLVDYGGFSPESLEASFRKIERKLGGQHLKRAVEALEAGDLSTAAGIALDYYDKAYRHSVEEHHTGPVIESDLLENDPEQAAEKLIALSAVGI